MIRLDLPKLRILIVAGVVLPAVLWPMAGLAAWKNDPAYGELVNRSAPVKDSMPGMQVRIAEPKNWRTDLEARFKCFAGDLANKAGIDEKTIRNFILPDDLRRIYLITEMRKSVQEQDRANRILSPSHPLSKRVSTLVSPHRFELGDLILSVKIYDNPGTGSFSSPDGSIRLERGLLERLSDGEILALFGHELGHITQLHQDKQMEQDAVSQFVLCKFSPEKKNKVIDWLKALQSKKHEFKADEFSFNWAKYHGYELTAHYTLFGKYIPEVRSAPGYPEQKEREARIQKLLEFQTSKKKFWFF